MNIFNRIGRPVLGMHTAAYLLAFMALISFGTSIFRDRLLAHNFGVGDTLDVYLAAFRIPDLFFVFLTAFISVFALIPILEAKQKESKQAMRDFIDTLFFAFSIVMVIGVTILFLLTPTLSEAIFSSFSKEQLDLLIPFTRIILLQVLLLGISTFLAALTQFQRRFMVYALTPIVYNIGIIIGILVLYPFFGIIGIVWGVVLGALFHIGIQLPWLFSSHIWPRLRPIQERLRDSYKAALISLPRALALTSHQIALLIIFGILTGISAGTLSVYWFADNLRSVPLALIGISYSIAAFPILATHFARHEYERFRDKVAEALQNTFFLVLPILGFLIIFPEEIIRILFETGLFDASTTRITAIVLSVLALSTLGFSVIAIAARAFYAAQKTLQPFLVFVISAILQVVVAHTIVARYATDPAFVIQVNTIFGTQLTGEAALVAIAISVTVIQLLAGVCILYLLHRTFGVSIKNIAFSFIQHVAATITFVAVASIIFKNFSNNGDVLLLFFALLVSTGAGLLAWGGMLSALRNKEWQPLQKWFLHKLQKR